MEAFNTQLMRFFDWLLWASLQGTVLIVMIVIIQKILRRRLPVHWHYFLWLLLLIRLAIPWLPESKMSIFNLVPRSIQQGRIIESFSQSRNSDSMGFYMRARSANALQTTEESEAFSVRFVRTLPALWLAGTVLIAGYVFMRSISLWRTVKRERPITDSEILDLLEDCKMQMGVETIIGVIVSDRIKSPALFGFVRPRLLLPQGMLETYGLEELRYVFIHELAHLKQRDIYLGWLMALLQVVHWFNPLMWFAFGRMRADRELACDRLAISTMGPDEPPEYGRTIVSLLESFSQVRYLPSVAGILEDTCQIERRIKMIADYKKTPRPRWTGAMLLLAVLACVVLTNAYVAKADFEFGTPTNLGSTVNTTHGESGPSISADGLTLYFFSGGPVGTGRPNGYGNGDIWATTRNTLHDVWDTPLNLGAAINTVSFEGMPSISADGLSLYFTSTRPDGKNWDIYVTTRLNSQAQWEEPVNIGPRVNSASGEYFPNISHNGLMLFFGSDRPGGHGFIDLYVAKRETIHNAWSMAVNLGRKINTAVFDGWPSISADGLSLYFSSFRPGGYGSGEDIWLTTRATMNDPWGEPVNLGPIVNTSSGDGCPCISADGYTLYFESDRPGVVGEYDLWQVPILPIVDLNGDGKVDFKDFRKLAQYWGQNEPSCDIAPLPNGDGIVDEKDLNLLAEYLLKELQPVAHWKLDEVEGNIAEDSIGGNDGTLNGNPVWQPDGGAVDGALQLDGIDGYVSTAFGLDPTKGSFSAFAWIKGGAPGQVIICQTGGTDFDTRWLWADPSYGRLMTWLMHPTYDPLVSESVITDGQWHHVGFVYDLDSFCRHLYVDGAEVAKDNSIVGGEPSDGGLYFGADKMLGQGTFFSGLIDDIRIYDEVLSAEEVAELAR